MKFTELESKLIILAMDSQVQEGEQDSAACKLIDMLRRRYSDGYSFLNEINGPNSARTYDTKKEYDRGYQAGYQAAMDVSNAYKRTYKSSYKRSSVSSSPRTETLGKSEDPSGDTVMTFGKHRGLRFRDFPLEYCDWAVNNCSNLSPELASAMRQWLKANGR